MCVTKLRGKIFCEKPFWKISARKRGFFKFFFVISSAIKMCSKKSSLAKNDLPDKFS